MVSEILVTFREPGCTPKRIAKNTARTGPIAGGGEGVGQIVERGHIHRIDRMSAAVGVGGTSRISGVLLGDPEIIQRS